MLTPKFTLIIAVIAIVIFVANDMGIFEGNNPTHNTTQHNTTQQYSIATNNYQPKNTLLPPSEPNPLQNELISHLSQAGWTHVAAETVAIFHDSGFLILLQNLASPPGVQGIAWSPIFNQPLIKGEL